MRRVVFRLLPLFAIIGVASDAAADPPQVKAAAVSRGATNLEADDGTSDRVKSSRAPLAAINQKLKPILAADPRVKQVIAEFEEITKISDLATRKAKLAALAPRVAEIRADAIKKSGVDTKIATATIANVRGLDPIIKVISQPESPAPGSLIETITTSTFSQSTTTKKNCPDDGDTSDFDGNKVKVRAKSDPGDEDCWGIEAGRGALVQVPAGTRKMTVSMTAKVDLDVVTMAFGWFAEAEGYLGIRVRSAPGASKTFNSIRYTKKIHAENQFPNPLPVDVGMFADDVQPGDATSSATFTFEDDVGSARIIPVVGGFVDADMMGVSKLNHYIIPKSLKISFYR